MVGSSQSLGNLVTYLTLNSDGLINGLGTAQNAMSRAGTQMRAIGRNMSLRISAPLIGLGGTFVKLATDFQTSMRKINTLVGIGTDRLNSMTSDVIGLSNLTGRSSKELADALFVITSAGQRGAEALDILERSAKASAIGLGETRAIAKTVTAAMNAYGKENLNAAQATEVLLGTVNRGNLIAEELAPVLGRVIGMSSSLGISFEEVGASIATFTRLGVDSAEAVTGLRGIMNSLLKPMDQADAALGKIGTNIEVFRKRIAKEGLAGVLIDLVEKFGDNEEAIADIVPNVRALATVFGTAGVQADSYREILGYLNTRVNELDKGFKSISGDTGFQFQKTLEQLKNTGIDLGRYLLPIVNNFLASIRDLIKRFNELDSSTKSMILTISGIAVAVGPAIWAIGALTTAIGFLTSPVGLIVAGIAALVAALTYAAVNWEALQERLSDWSWWKNALIDIVKFTIKYNPFNGIVEAANWLARQTGGEEWRPFDGILESLENAKNETKEYTHTFTTLGETIDVVKNKLKSMLGIAKGGLQQPALLGGGEKSNPIQSLVPNLDSLFSGNFANLITQMKGGLQQLSVNLLYANSGLKQVKEEGLEVAEVFAGILINSFDGLGNAIISGLESGLSAMESFKQFFINWAKGLLAKMISLIVTGLILGAVLSLFGAGVNASGEIAKDIKFATSIGNILKSGLGLQGDGNVKGLAAGGNVTQGGVFKVHKGELVSLPAGSSVTPINTTRENPLKGAKLVAEVSGRSLRFVLKAEDDISNNSFGA